MFIDYIKKNLGWVIPVAAVFVTFIICVIFLLGSRVSTPQEKVYIYISPNTSKTELVSKIKSQDIVFNSFAFDILSKIFRYNKVYSGRYELKDGMSLVMMINKLAHREQSPVRLIINKFRTKQEFAEFISNNLSINKDSMLIKLNSNEFLKEYGLDSTTSLSLIIPNTYEIYWDISCEDFIKRMNKEQEKFWLKRLSKLKESGLTKLQVLTIASIVEEETNMNDEKSRVAGVYINRLNKGMPLQADPTIKFAIGDFTIKRVAGDMLDIESPYNTYRNIGLPPGPICIASITTIDAVLNYERHNFLYFCAREDFSGYHNFAVDFDSHINNARRYQRALNALGIEKAEIQEN